jgi:hypothetical protein
MGWAERRERASNAGRARELGPEIIGSTEFLNDYFSLLNMINQYDDDDDDVYTHVCQIWGNIDATFLSVSMYVFPKALC